MAIKVTHAGLTIREMGITTVTEIGGISENGAVWRLNPEAFDRSGEDYYIEAGGHRVPVACHENREQGYRYFLAPGSEEKTDLLHHLEPLP